MGALREGIPAGRGQEVAVLAVKLLVHVVLPAVLLLALGARLKPLFESRLPKRQFWLTFVVFFAILNALLAVFSPSLQETSALSPSVATLAWA